MEFSGMASEDAAREIGLVVSYVLRENPWNYLNELKNRGIIPLRLSDIKYQEVSQELIRHGCLEAEVRMILSKE
jgi:hypothetical protein